MEIKIFKILAIDDNPDNLISLKALIKEAFPDATVFTATSGKRGLELSIQKDPDVILLDIVMPEMDGFEVCRKLKADQQLSDIPVVFVTAQGDKESRIKALECGGEAFLTKPVDESELTAQIRAMVKIKTANTDKRNENERLKKLVEEQTWELEAELFERKRAEKTLKQSEEKYSILFQNSPDSYLIISDGVFIDCNKAAEILLRGDRSKIIGQTPAALSPEYQPDGKKSSESAVDRINYSFKVGEKTFEWMHRRFDGTNLYVEVSLAPMVLNGKPTLFTTWRDISARKLTEQALQESEAQFREFFEKAADAIFIADIETGVIVDVNEAATRLINKSYEQLIGIHQSQLHPPVKENYAKDTFAIHTELVKQKVNSHAVENTVLRADGSEVPVEILASEVDYHGKNCMMGTFRDITERKKAEKAIQASEEKYRYMFENNPQPMWIYDHNSLEILEVNNVSTKIYGYSREEFLSMTIKDIRPAEDIPLMLEDVEKSRLEENSLGEWRHLKKSGEIMNVEISASSIIFNGRKARHVLIKDITERKRAEAALWESQLNFKALFEKGPIGVAYHRMIYDEFGKPVDYLFLDANQSYQKLTGVNPVGKLVTEAFPGIENDPFDWIGTFGEVAKTGKEIRFQQYLQTNNRWYDCVGYQYKPDHFVAAFFEITEKRLAEMALLESNELNNTLLKTIPFGMDIVDEQGNILFQSENMENVFSKTAIGCKCWDLYRDDKIQCSDCPLLSGIEIGKTATYETSSVLGGRIFQISHTGLMFKGKVAMLEIFQDITDRKESEKALQESEERYRRFISQVSEGVYRFESDEPMDIDLPLEEQIDFMYDHLTIAECNDAFLKMYGTTNQPEMIGKTMIDLHGGRDNESNRAVLHKFIENNYHLEETVTEELNTKGQKIYISNTSLGILENNKLIRVWGTQSDISSRVRDSQVQQVLYSISNAALSSIDLSELIEFISKEIGKLFDSTNFYIAFYDEKTNMLSTIYERDEKDVFDTWPAEKSITGYVIRHQKSMRITYDDVQKLCDDGEIEIFGTPSKVWLGVPLIMNKKVIGALVVQSYEDPEAYTEQDKLMLEFISHQISISIERKKAEQELNAALTKAQESDRLKSSFLANMSHEIRTPLNSIIGFSELMTDPAFDSGQQVDFAKMINASGTNLLAIINDIVDISKIEAGQIHVKKAGFSATHLIADIQKEYSFNASKKGIELRLDPSNPKHEVIFDCDENRIRQVLVNLIGNAIKFTKSGFIEIGIRTTDKFIQFHVKDTGIGIPKENHALIFERFRQLESAETKKYGGNGLGLAISKSLVELLGGTIWIESAPEQGSVFYFSIPL